MFAFIACSSGRIHTISLSLVNKSISVFLQKKRPMICISYFLLIYLNEINIFFYTTVVCMPSTSYKIICSLIAAVVVPCFGRIALHGSGVEGEIVRYIVPLIVGSTSGLLIGHFLDKWRASMKLLEKKNRQLRVKSRRLNTATSWHSALFEKCHSIILIIDPKTGKIIDANPQACSFYGYPEKQIKEMTVYQVDTQSKKKISHQLAEAGREKRKLFYLKHRLASGEIKDVEVFSGAINIDNTPLLLSFVQDITELNRLRGILSICSHCKKIRNKNGSWTNFETFIECNSAVDFSHGLCPACIDKLYPNHFINTQQGTLT